MSDQGVNVDAVRAALAEMGLRMPDGRSVEDLTDVEVVTAAHAVLGAIRQVASGLGTMTDKFMAGLAELVRVVEASEALRGIFGAEGAPQDG